jgi:RNA polymerase sigma factor (sigma-70 family)
MALDTSKQAGHSGLRISVRNGTEAKLWQEFKSGDEASFALIYQKFFPCLFSYGIKVCPDQEVVKDCIQDLFIYIWHNRGSLADTDSIKYYLWTALKRRILRAISSSHDHHLEDNALMLPITEEGIEDLLITEEVDQERKDQLLSVMRSLTKRQRQAVNLKFFHNLKNEEIADRMSVGVETVYNLISKSLTVLRKGIVKSSIIGFLLNTLLHN